MARYLPLFHSFQHSHYRGISEGAGRRKDRIADVGGDGEARCPRRRRGPAPCDLQDFCYSGMSSFGRLLCARVISSYTQVVPARILVYYILADESTRLWAFSGVSAAKISFRRFINKRHSGTIGSLGA